MLSWLISKFGNLFSSDVKKQDIVDLLVEILNSLKDGKLTETEVLVIKDKILKVLADFGYSIDQIQALLKKS